MGNRVEETARTLEVLFKLIEEIVGINPITLGSSPDPNAPVGTTEAALQATSNVLKPIMDACFEIKESAGTAMMRRIQVGIRNSDKIRKGYEGVISLADMEAIRRMENEDVQYGLSLKAKPDSQTKAKFTQYMSLALQNVREQRPGIEVPDALYFETKLDSGADILELYEELRYVIEKNKAEAKKDQLEMIQAQGQTNQQLEQTKQQAALELEKQTRQGAIAEEQMRGQIKALLMQKESNLKLLQQAYSDMVAESTGQPLKQV
jgi:hypothetical protein